MNKSIDILQRHVHQQCSKFMIIVNFILGMPAILLFEPGREKTVFLHMRKQRRRSASRCYREADQRLCFPYMDRTIPEISSF